MQLLHLRRNSLPNRSNGTNRSHDVGYDRGAVGADSRSNQRAGTPRWAPLSRPPGPDEALLSPITSRAKREPHHGADRRFDFRTQCSPGRVNSRSPDPGWAAPPAASWSDLGRATRSPGALAGVGEQRLLGREHRRLDRLVAADLGRVSDAY
jgi:hypothetical protein